MTPSACFEVLEKLKPLNCFEGNDGRDAAIRGRCCQKRWMDGDRDREGVRDNKKKKERRKKRKKSQETKIRTEKKKIK
jgi:hypothetical protein